MILRISFNDFAFMLHSAIDKERSRLSRLQEVEAEHSMHGAWYRYGEWGQSQSLIRQIPQIQVLCALCSTGSLVRSFVLQLNRLWQSSNKGRQNQYGLERQQEDIFELRRTAGPPHSKKISRIEYIRRKRNSEGRSYFVDILENYKTRKILTSMSTFACCVLHSKW